MTAGFIGLGAMGLPMARNLIGGGHELIVYNRTRSRAATLQEAGVTVAASVREACQPGIILTMLADDDAGESTVRGAGGILDSLPAQGIHVSMSTISVALAERLAQAHIAYTDTTDLTWGRDRSIRAA